MITVLLEKIIQILEGWIQNFTSHAQHVEDKLDSLDQTASDIETNTEPISDIKDNTGAVITPIQNIKSNTDSIKTSSQTSSNNTTAILNNVGTLSTNTGRAAAYAQDCANNTLEIKDKITTIASDTTNIRATDNNIYGAVNDIKDLLQYYFITNIVTEDSEGVICNFDTDLEDYLQKAICTIPADAGGFSSIDVFKNGKNIFNLFDCSFVSNNIVLGGYISGGNVILDNTLFLPKGTYTVSANEPMNGFYISDSNESFAVKYNATFITFTLDSDKYIAVRIYKHGTSSRDAFAAFNIQLEVSSSATDYEPYKEIKNTVSLGSTITDGAEVDLLSGIVKINSSPVTYSSITPIAIRTYKGINNIYSNVGTMSTTYRETLKHYLDKNNQ